tara:strand:- start:352 stop:1071 length:720 start_codon:yes stop_codon:yes gene_type:complete
MIFSLIIFCLPAKGQELYGTIKDKQTEENIPEVHVINKRTLKGTVSNREGEFLIKLQFGDTIVFSNISYKYLYFVYNDSSALLENTLVEMEEQNYLLHEVSIFSYELTSNAPKEMKIDEPLYPSNDEIGDGKIIRASPSNPAEYLYNLFGSKPKQLRKLAILKAEDAYREKLEVSNNRESVISLTGLSKDELEAFMFYCKFTQVRMNHLNDYDFLLAVQRCYAQYVRDKELEGFLEQFD